MNKIDTAEFPELKHRYYEFFNKYPSINAVISNEQDGFVYSDAIRNNLFVCAKYGWSLLLAEDPTEIGALFEILKSNREIPDYIHLYPPNKTLINYLEGNWNKYKIRKRCQFRYIKKLPIISKEILPSGFLVSKIQDIDFSKLDVFKLDLGKRYWRSKDDFIMNAIGVCIENPINEPVAICYSICIADDIAEVEILVLPEFKGKGFGRIISESFLNLTIEKGIIAHWDTFILNTPSFELVQKLGFQKIQEYDLVSTFLRNW
jgi:GNAT superfamily N-acetyltransferase